jgi:ATP-binding cassette, subfamily C, bacterial LapB
MSADTEIRGRAPLLAPWLTEPMLRHKATYLKVGLAAAIVNLFGLVSSMFTMTVYDRVVPNNATASLIALTIGLVIVIVFDFILRLLRAYFVDVAGADIDQEIGEAVFARILALRLDMKKGSTGWLAGLMRELETLREFFASATLTALVDVPFILITLALMAAIGGWVVMVPLAMIPLVVLTGVLTQPALDRLSAKSLGEGLVKQSVLVEVIGGLEAVKASGAGPMLSRRWSQAIRSQADSALRQRLVATIGVTVATSANTIAYAGVVVVGVGLIASRDMTTGGLVACSILAGRAVAPLAQIAQLLSRITMTQTAYQQLNGLMQTPIEGPEGDPLKLNRVGGGITFRNVSFRYPGAAENALDGVNFAIQPGERVALLGRVGSGKSTIARLVLGLYPPEDGLVLIDGTDIRQLDPAVLRRETGTAMQESVLFSGSVRDNIALGRERIDDEELLRASVISGTHDFIGQMANGYDLRLADRGEGLSGGQRQSIAIARALAGKPSMFIFDEPSSAMDAQTENALIARLRPEVNGKTVILVTHRTPLLQLVDRIILLDQGKVIADGPRDAVLARIAQPSAPKAA